MFGIPDPGVWIAYLLCILCAAFCVIYGALNWNKGDDPIFDEDQKWAVDEKEAEENI